MSIRSRHQFGASCRLGSTERKVQPVGGPKVEDQRFMVACGTSGGHVTPIRSWCLELLSSWFPQIAFSVLRPLLQLRSLHATERRCRSKLLSTCGANGSASLFRPFPGGQGRSI